jgi:hypothetical protein
MIKKFVYIGLVMILIAVIMGISAGYLLTNSATKQLSASNLTINPNSFADLPIQTHNSTALAIYSIADNLTNLYLLNSTTFSKWSSYMFVHRNASGLDYVESLGVNSSDIFKNKSNVYTQVLQTSSSNAASVEYVVIDNTPGSASSKIPVNATVTYIPLQLSSLVVYEIPVIIGFIVGVAGIIIIIYGILKRRPETVAGIPKDGSGTKDEKEKAYVEQLYKGIGKKRRKGQAKE